MDALSQAVGRLLADLDATGAPVRAPVASADHAAIAAAAVAAALDAPLVVVAPTATAAERVASLARWLLDHGPAPRSFPRWPRGAESPYEDVVESPFVAAARSGVLGSLCLSETPVTLVLDAATAARRVVPFDAYMDGVQRVEVGRELDLTALSDLLVAGGYRRVATVSEVGEFAVRGGVADVFSPFADDPFRLDLDGDTVAGLKAFDPATQRAQRTLAATWIVPAWELPANPGRFRDALIRLAEAAAEAAVGSKQVAVIEALFGQGRLPPGFAAMLPLLHGSLDTVLSYLPEQTVLAVLDPEATAAGADAAVHDLEEAFDAHRAEKRPMAPPAAIAATGRDLLEALAARPRTLLFDSVPGDALLGPPSLLSRSSGMTLATAPDVAVRDRVGALCRLAAEAADGGERVLVLAPSDGEARRVRDVLSAEGVDATAAGRHGLSELGRASPGVAVGVGRVRAPFGLEVLGTTVVPSEAVFGVKDALAGRRGERRGARRLEDFRELDPGDLVIHRDHGVGRFEGLREVGADGRTTECLVLSYRNGDRLYVPVDRAGSIEKYVAPADGAAEARGHALDRLGSQSWQKRKKSARHAAREIAGMLKAIYARRSASSAHAFAAPDADFREFEATFPYETTPDQDRAIDEVLDDMGRDKPMDRLVCGDVGFGKTEVAVRAAYHAVMEGRQVAVLVPTTILAEQHRLTFAARLRGTPVTVESLSRLRTGTDERRILDGVRDGGVDVVIGTHRLLSKDLSFRDLGLLVVDEEHRFGVVHKERLREIAATVHTLTLSATPIPRTLHMALSGIRELSVISTPPKDRLAVRTFVARASRELVRSAVTRELSRNGQVFVVHNRVEDICAFANGIQDTVPEARVAVAHGQMSAGELESVMAAFVRGDKDVLVCTTIIESGLDIGSANTMLIHDAESLGLAQLYQLRGRVGRSTEQAYCYLLVRDPATMTDDARRRIEAIERFSELASGFNLAAMDMEIRGAGNVLGAEQSGHMAAVGYDLFMEMIRDAVQELSGEVVPERLDPELKVEAEARIPSSYVDDERIRLRLYKRLSSARDLAEVASIASEIADRFGPRPEAVERLVALMRVKVLAREAGIALVAIKGDAAQFGIAPGHVGAGARLVAALHEEGFRPVAADPDGRVRAGVPKSRPAIGCVEDVLVRAVAGPAAIV
ncbi:MAG: transcription-repair coupling factor [Deltaproteobacteria bacterium]|nr:transcription-repair coupling factor [Deltaproteobacteria bacterium]